MTKLILISAVLVWVTSSSAVKIHIHQDTVIGSIGDDVMLPVTYTADVSVRIIWVRNKNCDFADGFVWCSSCTHSNIPNPSSYTGHQFQGRVSGFEKNASIILKSIRLEDRGHFCVKVENLESNELDDRNTAYGIITLLVKNIRSARSVQCPVVQPGPASGIIAVPLPGILINNIDFMHIPVVLNFSDWTMSELSLCGNSNTSSLYASLLKDVIEKYQGRTRDSTIIPPTFVQSGTLHLSSSQQALTNMSKYIESQFAMKMPIWNNADMENIMRHVSYFQRQTTDTQTKPMLHGIEDLAKEEHYTVYNMNEITKMIRQTNSTFSQQGYLSKESICNAYGNSILNTITALLKDVEDGHVPNVITNEEMAKWYCPNCVSKNENSKQFWECVNLCKKLQFSTIRNVGSVTPHPNNVDCSSLSSCSDQKTMYISFTISLPVYDLATSVFDRLATIQSVGLLEDDIFKERLALPPLIIFHHMMYTWLSPHSDCCFVKGYKYICRCDVFNVIIPVCGYDNQRPQNNTDTFTVSCPVRLTKWRVPVVKVSQSANGFYCIVTNQRKYLYGSLSCDITNPNFCFTPQEYTVIGHTIITPLKRDVPLKNPEDQDTDKDIHQFNVDIPALTLKLKSLLVHKYTHLIQVTNYIQKDAQLVNEMLNSGDNNLIDNSLDHVEVTIKILIVLEVIVILIVLFMLYCFCNMLRHQGLNMNTLFLNPYLRM